MSAACDRAGALGRRFRAFLNPSVAAQPGGVAGLFARAGQVNPEGIFGSPDIEVDKIGIGVIPHTDGMKRSAQIVTHGFGGRAFDAEIAGDTAFVRALGIALLPGHLRRAVASHNEQFGPVKMPRDLIQKGHQFLMDRVTAPGVMAAQKRRDLLHFVAGKTAARAGRKKQTVVGGQVLKLDGLGRGRFGPVFGLWRVGGQGRFARGAGLSIGETHRPQNGATHPQQQVRSA